ncbi:MAG: 2-C-methyl-D-erythritol 4-phosphate cytidylyltransferase [Chlamydiales bacterium]
MIPFSVIFLAGGVGSRMQAEVPKQYLLLQNKPLALHSFEVFLSLPEVEEIIVVCEKEYEHLFNHAKLIFAPPGIRRQDSVFNGIQALKHAQENRLVCIHDSARPLIDVDLVRRVVHMAGDWGAAVAGVQVKSTIKLCDAAQVVVNTLDRSHLWEIQTPQVVGLNLLKEGFKQAHERNLTVTDDVSLVELIGKPVKVVEGSYRNIKVTTPEDLILVNQYLEK